MKTERTRNLPPFFTQVIGSLPRPKLVRDLRARHAEMSAARFHQVMDEMTLFASACRSRPGWM
jgi:methionine synthase II (cobalamin-independent)